jgi:phage tail sheath protein FI
MAERAATRGAWVAPANHPFADVVALAPAMPREGLARLLAAQVNALRLEPSGFMCLAADTLAIDADARPVNVRRLIALLRRLALLRGAEYVFEPNDPAFRRSVQRGFEDLLRRLYLLGAFAGATPEQSYQVRIADQPQAIERGRLVVELRVAPSRPLAFLVVRLVHTGDRGFALEAAR